MTGNNTTKITVSFKSNEDVKWHSPRSPICATLLPLARSGEESAMSAHSRLTPLRAPRSTIFTQMYLERHRLADGDDHEEVVGTAVTPTDKQRNMKDSNKRSSLHSRHDGRVIQTPSSLDVNRLRLADCKLEKSFHSTGRIGSPAGTEWQTNVRALHAEYRRSTGS